MLTGAHLVERLVLLPNLHVHAWKLHENSPVGEIHSALLLIRRLGVYNTVLITQRALAIRTLEEVPIHKNIFIQHCSLALNSIIYNEFNCFGMYTFS